MRKREEKIGGRGDGGLKGWREKEAGRVIEREEVKGSGKNDTRGRKREIKRMMKKGSKREMERMINREEEDGKNDK